MSLLCPYQVLQKYCNSYDKFLEDREKASKELEVAKEANDGAGTHSQKSSVVKLCSKDM